MQQPLLEAVWATGKPVVLVLFNGSPLSINWAAEHVPAILEAWYPGEEGGTALAEILFGDDNPAGRLPITFVKSLDQVPPFTDYRLKGRTYRYLEDEPLYPFGYGLSYTSFTYHRLRLSSKVVQADEPLEVSVEVENTGERAGDEVVQLYLKDLETSGPAPICALQGFTRIHLQPGEKRTVSFTVTPRQRAFINDEGKCLLEPGTFRVTVGGSQPDARSEALTGVPVLAEEFEVIGAVVELESGGRAGPP